MKIPTIVSITWKVLNDVGLVNQYPGGLALPSSFLGWTFFWQSFFTWIRGHSLYDDYEHSSQGMSRGIPLRFSNSRLACTRSNIWCCPCYKFIVKLWPQEETSWMLHLVSNGIVKIGILCRLVKVLNESDLRIVFFVFERGGAGGLETWREL